MGFKLLCQSFCLTFLVWFSMMLMINCTLAHDGVRHASASEERMKHLKEAEASIFAGRVAKEVKKEVQGDKHLQDVFSAISKNAEKHASFHISKANKLETLDKKARVTDSRIHRHLSESSMVACRHAKESKKEVTKVMTYLYIKIDIN